MLEEQEKISIFNFPSEDQITTELGTKIKAMNLGTRMYHNHKHDEILKNKRQALKDAIDKRAEAEENKTNTQTQI